METKVEKPSQAKLDELGVSKWPVWEKEVGSFEWSYDSDEMFYVLDGKAKVAFDGGPAAGRTISFGKGDYVSIPKGSSGTWTVIEKIRKHYKMA